ncbi:hypothetical protein [Stenotrophomonas nitritireducens]|jgi:hypothetical protein|uniref:hypothetical protein n=1 Tax=Stenotrophomonas nitritireducens TaxID=83617 RepID=UPI003D95C4D5
MNYEEARADLDDLVLEMMDFGRGWSQSQRLDKLRSLAILARRAMSAASGSSGEWEYRNSIESLLGRMERAMAMAVPPDAPRNRFETERGGHR